ncbi:Lysine exporter protein (LYSE/YGGA) [Segniliparus rotundus DSM 44985]|uniref:Lysine exporter protein (LYSE/YGGA) n=1 Tax=Segniliparus rotundus (strain ATCC BAA-972 / CDC 1076 / CIP 108378 / DSM 44985 / JCM 13578) TaxID=640132 RepID=D6ZBN6_SEGRD|nr:LysE family translocator [Segniliparus rotundus]ADG98988.1 Lysine exporter protein (LYSE/YGGA) [Segniliparus rotundus DSM 44985]
MHQYLAFVLFAGLLALAPGPDMLLTIQATVVGGRARGFATVAGIATAAAAQGLLVAWGLAAVLTRSQPLFLTLRLVGALSLLFLGFSAIRAAVKGDFATSDEAATTRAPKRRLWSNARQGFLCNITNPKVLMFNLAVLPQFVSGDAPVARLLAYSLTLVGVGTVVLVLVSLTASAARRALAKARAQRVVNAVTGTAMLGFATALAAEG